MIARDSRGDHYMALLRFLPIFSQSEATKASLLSPSLKSRPLSANTFTSLQSSRLNLCQNALSNSVGYGGLGSLHCSCYFSNYIVIKLFFRSVHWHDAKVFSWLYWADMLQQFNFLASGGNLASLCPVCPPRLSNPVRIR